MESHVLWMEETRHWTCNLCPSLASHCHRAGCVCSSIFSLRQIQMQRLWILPVLQTRLERINLLIANRKNSEGRVRECKLLRIWTKIQIFESHLECLQMSLISLYIQQMIKMEWDQWDRSWGSPGRQTPRNWAVQLESPGRLPECHLFGDMMRYHGFSHVVGINSLCN